MKNRPLGRPGPLTHSSVMETPLPPAPQDLPQTFLTPPDTLLLRHGLRGVDRIEIRLVGDHPAVAAEVTAFMAALGLEVSFRQIDRMMPPPLRRFVFRYGAGKSAELTVAPEAPPPATAKA